jgi:hypothetical protein
MFNETAYSNLGGLSGAKVKAQLRTELGIAPGTKLSDEQKALAKQRSQAQRAAKTAPAPSSQTQPGSPASEASQGSDGGGFFGLDIPKKTLGVPTMYWLIGGALFALTILKPGRKKR